MPNKTIGQLPPLPAPAGSNEFAVWNGSATFRISLDTIKQYSISGITDNDIYVTGGTYNPLTSTITLFRNDDVTIPITGISTEDIYLTGGTYNDSLITLTDNVGNIVQFNVDTTTNRWHVPSGTTLTVKNGFQSFIYGDLYVEGLLYLDDDAQLVVLNGDIILSGGSISGSGTTIIVDLPEIDTKTVSGSYNPNTGVATFTNNTGGTFTVSGFYTGTTEIFVTGGTYNMSNGVATFTNNTGGTFDVSGFLTGYTNFYTTGATLIGATAYFDRTDALSAYTLDLSGIDFTGNTPSSCINDLYLSNLHGCSPLTVHDSIQHNTSNASGLLSTAFGASTIASGNYSHAEGYYSSSFGEASHVEGYFVSSLGLASHAEGLGSTAQGVVSHAEGSSLAIGSTSHSEGANTTAQGNYSHSEGQGTTAQGEASHAEGSGTKAIGINSHAEGYITTASGQYSHAEGYRVMVTGDYGAHAEGYYTSAISDSSHAEGSYSTASGIQSHAEGAATRAIGYASHSEGTNTTASGFYSHAGGSSSIASGINSFIHSSGSTVTGIRSVVLGGKGLSGPANDTVYVPNFDSRGVSRFSGSSTDVVTIIGSGSTSPLFKVQGSSGELFSVTDSLVGSLFSVNDISGLPILEVFSDNTILAGSYQAPSLNTTVKKTLSAGVNNIYAIPTSGYTGAFFDYTLMSASGARAGNIMSIWSGSSAQYTDVATNDFGSTTGVTFSVIISGSSAVLQGTSATSGWTLKTIVRSI